MLKEKESKNSTKKSVDIEYNVFHQLNVLDEYTLQQLQSLQLKLAKLIQKEIKNMLLNTFLEQEKEVNTATATKTALDYETLKADYIKWSKGVPSRETKWWLNSYCQPKLIL